MLCHRDHARRAHALATVLAVFNHISANITTTVQPIGVCAAKRP